MKYLFTLLLLSQLNSFSQSPNLQNAGKISGYYSVEESIIGGNNPIVIGNKVLLYTIGMKLEATMVGLHKAGKVFFLWERKKV